MLVLLTGAAGFLGSHLAQKVLSEGHDLVGLDDLSTGSLDNISEIIEHERFKFINHDVREPIDIKVDAILNFACPASPKNYQLDPVRTIETSFLGTINMLRLAKENGAKILHASTSEVYGDPAVSPQPETYWGNVNPTGIRSCYDEGKRAAETLCFDYKRQHNIDARVVRIFNTYGPNMSVDDGRVVSNFIVQALSDIDITIYGDGSQTRSFCYVSDLVEGIYRCFMHQERLDTPVNLGNPVEISIAQLAKSVISQTNSRSKIVYRELPEDDPRQRKPDTALVEKLLNWQANISLHDGLDLTIEYFRKQINK